MSRPRASLGVPPNDLYIEPVPWPRIGRPPKHDADACTVMALFDESKENAKHVLRALKENARQGFWNGPRRRSAIASSRQDETGCKGRSIPMEKLDNLVAEHLADRLLQPERLEEILASVLDRGQARAERGTRLSPMS
jgi:hypothetical protein